MRTTTVMLALATLSVAFGAVAQDLPNLVERIEVRVINVDVVVTDRNGNPVRGLTKDDFEIMEGRAARPISNFYEASSVGRAEAAPTADVSVAAAAVDARQRRRIIVFIDQYSLHPENRNLVLKHLRTFLTDSVRASDEVMIASYNTGLAIRLPFTSNPKAIHHALDVIQRESALGVALIHHRHQTETAIRRSVLPGQRMQIARAYALNAEQHLRGTVEALQNLMTVVSGVEGKKILVTVGESLPIHPGREILTLLDNIEQVQGDERTAEELRIDIMQAPQRWSLMMDMSFNARDIIEGLAKTANANGITVYPIHAAGISGGGIANSEYAAESETHGLATAALHNSKEAMHLIADMTGGIATTGSHAAYAPAFERIREDLESYYSLGYRATDDKPADGRAIRVRVKNPEYVVRARRQRIDKTPTQEMSDQAVANLLDVRKPNDLGIVISTGNPLPAGRGRYRVPIKLLIPMDALTMLPQGTLHVGGFEVFAVVADQRHALSDVVRSPHRLTFDENRFNALRGGTYTYSLDLMVRGGTNELSFAVIDAVSGTQGFGKTVVRAE